MPNSKRKRKRVSSTSSKRQTPVKKAKTPAEGTPKTPKTDTKSPRKKRQFPLRREKPKKKYNKRRRLKFMRMQLAAALERALVGAPGIPILAHLFTERDSMGTPRAPFQEVLRQLRISVFVKNSHFLRSNHMKSLSQFSSLFAVDNDVPDGPLYLKYWPIYDRKAATVYVDNLPEACNEEQLMRLATCYGNVAELRIARKGHRWVRPRYVPPKKRLKAGAADSNKKGKKKKKPVNPANIHRHRIPPKKKPLIDVGSRPKQWAWIRFCDADSAKQMVEAFHFNDPTIPFENFQAKMQKERDEFEEDIQEFGPGDPENPAAYRTLLHFHHPFRSLATMKLIREIERLKKRRRHRPWPMYQRLFKLRLRLRALRARERSCREKAGLVRKLCRRKGKRRRMADRQRYLEHLKRLEEEEQARLDAIAEEQERLDNIEMGLLPPDEPSTSSAPVMPNRPKAPAKDLNLLKAVTEKRSKKAERQRQINKDRRRKKRRNKRKKGNENKRKRKKMCRRLGKYIHGGVRKHFQDIQVLPLTKYLKLREDWKSMQNDQSIGNENTQESVPLFLPDLD